MSSSFSSVGLVDLLESDPRPTFVVALPSGDCSVCEIVHQNHALVADATLLGDVRAAATRTSHAAFWNWVARGPLARSAHTKRQDSFVCLDICWTRSVVKGQWAVVGANETLPSPEPTRKKRRDREQDAAPHNGHAQECNAVSESPPNREQTERNIPSLAQSETDPSLRLPDFASESELFLDVIQSVDWDANVLGPMDKWPVRLQQAFNQVIPESRAIAIYWGPQYISIYNEAFSKFCGTQHPQLLGHSVTDTWPHLKQHLDHVMSSSSKKYSKIEDESRFFLEKPDGTSEEIYIKWSLSPIVENLRCLGIYHSLLETTSMRLWERRMKMLIDLGDTLITARDVKSYWAKTIEELERWSPTYDVPLAFIYSVSEDDDADSTVSRYDAPRTCRLEGSLGVPDGHPIAPPILELRDTDDGLASRFREALTSQTPLLLQVKESLPERLLHGLQWRGFGDPCQSAIICPIRPTKDEAAMGILFLGLNPRRPFDNDYRQFISLLNQKLTSSLASTVLLEQEARRGQNLAQQAENDRALLQSKLEYQIQQANQSIQTFKAVSGFIPVGMSFGDAQGNVTFANDAWHRITGYPKGPIAPGALLECVLEEDREKIIRAYEDIKEVDVVTFEFRIPRDKNQPDNRRSPGRHMAGADDTVGRHVLASAKAERDLDGCVVRILTCLTDVTVQKHTAEEAIRRAQEAENLKRLAEFATVGMFDMSLDGRLLSTNNLFWELSGLPKVDLTKHTVEPWHTCVVEEDLPILWQSLQKLKETAKPQTAEVRFNSTWTEEDASGNTIEAPQWVLATFMPVRSSEGVIQSFTGCLSDVSLQKWQLEQEKLRKEEAIESKRQQENFIDMTSHEMRNPLSAMLHCTDAIIASLSRIQDIDESSLSLTPGQTNGTPNGHPLHTKDRSEERKLLRDSIGDAETIVTCAQHQKRIVDDILTMSKLDSKLLAVTPCTVNPIEIVNDALMMFEVEARRVDIALTSVVDNSYTALGHEFLDLDPSRVKQVLINLLTNALKFTKTGKTRNVTICVKGSRERPTREMTAVEFIPRYRGAVDDYEQPALRGRTNPVYLMFEVRDTGQGLTEGEMGNLFNKFVQADAKTHVKYGGSGLGLFISRRLTELQNGAIGVSSQAGVGSTFAFYIEAYVPNESARRDAEAMAAARRLVAGTDLTGMGSASGTSSKLGLSRDKSQRRLHSHGVRVPLDGILVVEDNLINQQITRRGLTEKGYSVDVANHGIEALDKLRRSVAATTPRNSRNTSAHGSLRSSPSPQPVPINLVLMDIEMPVQDGLTCTRHIRELEQKGEILCASGSRIPIIAVTANARPEQIMEAKAAGCDDVMVKPYRIPELIDKMLMVNQRVGGLLGATLPLDPDA